MKTVVTTLKVLFWITAISMIVTILLSLYNNYCGNWFILWSNSITTGIFASSLVVLISEFVRYKHLKSEFESELYYNLSLLYLKLKSTVYAIDKSYQEPLPRLTSAFLKPQLAVITDGTEKTKHNILQYCTLRENEVSKTSKSFALHTVPRIFNIIFAIRDIEVAINKDILAVYQNNINSCNHKRDELINDSNKQYPHIVASSPATNEALQKIVVLINNELFESIESLLSAISNSKSNNFDWEKDKERILKLV